MKIIAVADVHSPKFLREFDESLSIHDRPDLLLLAGDMINFGKVTEYVAIVEGKIINSRIYASKRTAGKSCDAKVQI